MLFLKSPQIGSFLPFFSVRALFFQRQILTCSDWPNHILKGTYGFVLMSRIYRLVLPIFFDTSFLKNRTSRAELFAKNPSRAEPKSEPSLGSGATLLERALRALASSSGRAACPGATRGQPRGSTPRVRGWFQGDLSEKKNFVTNARTNGRTDRLESRNSDLDCTNFALKLPIYFLAMSSVF